MSKADRFFQMKREGKPIAWITGYDAPSARAQAAAGADVILIGDSVGTNILGYASEREVTLDDIAHHTRAVRRGAPDTFLISDMPWATYTNERQAVDSARKLVAAGADMVKFEGALPRILKALVEDGVLVCSHLGLEPQNHEQKRLKGKTAADARAILDDALMMDAAGHSMLLLELIPEELSEAITKAVKAPTIGIGAGRATDGQVLVWPDVLGYTEHGFRHNRRYAEVGKAMFEAASAYVRDVHARRFPGAENVFHMPKDELDLFLDKKPAA
jgi:3-methyl-2-oxobutanoate hydroxymethyltransferase